MERSLIGRIWLFYYEGFKGMTIGKTLWIIIIIKIFILFFVFKLFFFKSVLGSYDTKEDKSQHIINELTVNKIE